LAADNTPHQVSSLLVQYDPKTGDMEENYKKIESLIRAHDGVFNMAVLPFHSFLGFVQFNKDNVRKYAEDLNGKSYQLASDLAKKYKTYVLFSIPAKQGNQYFETTVLIDYTGKQVAAYRKSHLNESEKAWATAGNELPIYWRERTIFINARG